MERREEGAPSPLTHLGCLPLSPRVPVDTGTCRRAPQLDARPAPGRGCVVRALCELAMVLKGRISRQRKRHRWPGFQPSLVGAAHLASPSICHFDELGWGFSPAELNSVCLSFFGVSAFDCLYSPCHPCQG